MKLVALDPIWLERDGQRVGIMFRCPHCLDTWLTCYSVAMPIWGEEVKGRQRWAGQMGYVRQALDRLKKRNVPENAVVPCERTCAWKFAGDTFETLSIQPSLDASASGHWHGFVTGGQVA